MRIGYLIVGALGLMAVSARAAESDLRVFFGVIKEDPDQRAWILPDGTWGYAPKSLPQKQFEQDAGGELIRMKAGLPWFADEKRLLEKLPPMGKAAVQPVDPVVVMPLLDPQGKTSVLGTMIAVMAMFQATFTPAKRLNLSFPPIVRNMVSDQLVDGRERPADYPADLMMICVTPHRGDGMLTVTDAECRVELTFSGPKGERRVTRAVPRAQAGRLPGLIALEIHGYLGTNLTDAERAQVERPDLPDEAALRTMGELLGRWQTDALFAFHEKHPTSVFAFVQAVASAIDAKRSDVGHLVAAMKKRVGPHPLVQIYEVRAAMLVEDRSTGMALALDLLARDRRNWFLMESIGWLGDKARWATRHAFDRWVAYDPDSFIAHRDRGNFYVQWAWRTRGSDYVIDLDPACLAAVKELLSEAERSLERALELNPRSIRSVLAMMEIVRRLDRPRPVMERWFEMGQKIDQETYRLYKAKLEYLLAHAKNEETLTFARACAARKPDRSVARLMLFEYHLLLAQREGPQGYAAYLTRPSVRAELEALFRSILAAQPDNFDALHGMAALHFFAGELREAAPYFARLDDQHYHGLWGYREPYEQAKKASLAAADPEKGASFFKEQFERMRAQASAAPKPRSPDASKRRPLPGPPVRWMAPGTEPRDLINWTSRTSFAFSYFGPVVGSRDGMYPRLLELPPGEPYTRLFVHVRGWGALPAASDVHLGAEVALGDRGEWTQLPPVRLAPGFKTRHLLESAKPFDRVRLWLSGRRTQIALGEIVAMRERRPAGEWIEADRFATVTAVDATTVTLRGDDGRTAAVPASHVSPRPSVVPIAILHPTRPARLCASGDDRVLMQEVRDGEPRGMSLEGPNPRPFANDIFIEGAELEEWHDGIGSWVLLARQPAWNVIGYGTFEPVKGVKLGVCVRDDGAVAVTRVQAGITEEDYFAAIQARDARHLRELLEEKHDPIPKELMSDPKLKVRPGVTLHLQTMAPGAVPTETARLLRAFIQNPANEVSTAWKARPIEPGDRVGISWSHRKSTFFGTYFQRFDAPELKIISRTATEALARTVTEDGSAAVEVSLPASLVPRSLSPLEVDDTVLCVHRVVPGTAP